MTQPHKHHRAALIWLPLLVILISGLGTLHYARTLAQARGTRTWTVVTGQITESEMELTRVGTKTVSSSRFAYTYEVNQQTFTSSRVSWANTAQSGTRLHQAGEEVTVYINPIAPNEAVLIRGVDTWTKIQVVLCTLVGLVGLWVLGQMLVSQR